MHGLGYIGLVRWRRFRNMLDRIQPFRLRRDFRYFSWLCSHPKVIAFSATDIPRNCDRNGCDKLAEKVVFWPKNGVPICACEDDFDLLRLIAYQENGMQVDIYQLMNEAYVTTDEALREALLQIVADSLFPPEFVPRGVSMCRQPMNSPLAGRTLLGGELPLER